jgi:hypothetical protein
MKFSMTGKEKSDLLIQGTAYINRGDHIDRFDCMYNVIYLCMNKVNSTDNKTHHNVQPDHMFATF